LHGALFALPNFVRDMTRAPDPAVPGSDPVARLAA
jgi:hypothetical protein